MSVDMKTLKELRAMTHAPLSDCKKALEASEGDL
jgi:translation elongation factor EF-Ts